MDAKASGGTVARWVGAGSAMLLAVSLSYALAACGATNGDDTFGGEGAGKSSSGGNPGANGAGGDFFDGGPSGSNSGGSGTGGGCAGTNIKAQKQPLDMYIMLDQSGSMTDPVSGGGDKWTAVTSALNAFVGQPQATGIGVGIQFFGLPTGGGMQCATMCMTDADCGGPMCGPCIVPIPMIPGICVGGATAGDSCTPADYATPAVAIEPLPGVGPKITAEIAKHMPSTSTPTSPALQGAVDYAKQWAMMNPDHVVIAVLATDGDPTECDTNLANIDAIAAAGVNGMPKILTFVIGVGGSVAALDGIAAAGGTGMAFLVDTNANVQQQFLDALNKIQGTALGCTYSIPAPMSGMPDYDSVNVEYTPGGGMPQKFPKVTDKAACPPNGDAWYYDNNAAPTKIILCDSTCAKVSADSMGEVNIVLGCETILN